MLRALTSFAGPAGRFVGEGDVVADDDPILAGREALFERVGVEVPVVEQATAAPGEVRQTARTPRKRTSGG